MEDLSRHPHVGGGAKEGGAQEGGGGGALEGFSRHPNHRVVAKEGGGRKSGGGGALLLFLQPHPGDGALLVGFVQPVRPLAVDGPVRAYARATTEYSHRVGVGSSPRGHYRRKILPNFLILQ